MVRDLDDLTVVAPAEAVLTWDIKPGDPRAEIKWFMEGKQLIAGGRHDMSYTNKSAKLKIKTTKPEDAGKYKCVASNLIGSVETFANLGIHSKFIFFGY